MTKTNPFHAIADSCGPLADVMTELDRYLGDLGDRTLPIATVLPDRCIVSLRAATAKGELRGSQWHKLVNKLSDLYGPGIVTRDTLTVSCRFETPFAVEVVVEVYHRPTSQAPTTTLEAVLA